MRSPRQLGEATSGRRGSSPSPSRRPTSRRRTSWSGSDRERHQEQLQVPLDAGLPFPSRRLDGPLSGNSPARLDLPGWRHEREVVRQRTQRAPQRGRARLGQDRRQGLVEEGVRDRVQVAGILLAGAGRLRTRGHHVDHRELDPGEVALTHRLRAGRVDLPDQPRHEADASARRVRRHEQTQGRRPPGREVLGLRSGDRLDGQDLDAAMRLEERAPVVVDRGERQGHQRRVEGRLGAAVVLHLLAGGVRRVVHQPPGPGLGAPLHLLAPSVVEDPEFVGHSLRRSRADHVSVGSAPLDEVGRDGEDVRRPDGRGVP